MNFSLQVLWLSVPLKRAGHHQEDHKLYTCELDATVVSSLRAHQLYGRLLRIGAFRVGGVKNTGFLTHRSYALVGTMRILGRAELKI